PSSSRAAATCPTPTLSFGNTLLDLVLSAHRVVSTAETGAPAAMRSVTPLGAKNLKLVVRLPGSRAPRFAAPHIACGTRTPPQARCWHTRATPAPPSANRRR